MLNVKYVVWDFDGVINKGIVDGRFIWSDSFENDIGLPLATFTDFIFSAEFDRVICGQKDLLDHLGQWADLVGYKDGPQKLLDYWLAHDNLPDDQIVDLMDEVSQHGVKNVIATNNEAHRTAYIENQMGFKDKVVAVFSSGHLKCSKPDHRFFNSVAIALGTPEHDLILIDDHLPNIESASVLGWQAHHFTNADYESLRKALHLG